MISLRGRWSESLDRNCRCMFSIERSCWFQEIGPYPEENKSPRGQAKFGIVKRRGTRHHAGVPDVWPTLVEEMMGSVDDELPGRTSRNRFGLSIGQ